MASTTQPPSPPGQAPPPDEKPSSKLDVLRRRRGRLLMALLLLLLATSVVIGSLAVFTGSSTNAGSEVDAGTLTIGNSKAGVAVITAAEMVPGETREGTVTITNTGTVAGQFRLSDSDLADTPGPNGGKLSGALDLRIVDLGPDGAPGGGDDVNPATYDGRFDSMPSIDLGTWPAGAKHTYRLAVTFRNTGAPGSSTTQDNAFKQSAAKVTYTWDATSE
jgi:hypothetical protein